MKCLYILVALAANDVNDPGKNDVKIGLILTREILSNIPIVLGGPLALLGGWCKR
jgi:hypothetical protein